MRLRAAFPSHSLVVPIRSVRSAALIALAVAGTAPVSMIWFVAAAGWTRASVGTIRDRLFAFKIGIIFPPGRLLYPSRHELEVEQITRIERRCRHALLYAM
jgi:hypothetical protein